MNSIVTEKLEPRENLERDIREGHKGQRDMYGLKKDDFGQSKFGCNQIWCEEGGDMADSFFNNDEDEIINLIANNYLGNGKYDELAIGHAIAAKYQHYLESELDNFDMKQCDRRPIKLNGGSRI